MRTVLLHGNNSQGVCTSIRERLIMLMRRTTIREKSNAFVYSCQGEKRYTHVF